MTVSLSMCVWAEVWLLPNCWTFLYRSIYCRYQSEFFLILSCLPEYRYLIITASYIEAWQQIFQNCYESMFPLMFSSSADRQSRLCGVCTVVLPASNTRFQINFVYSIWFLCFVLFHLEFPQWVQFKLSSSSSLQVRFSFEFFSFISPSMLFQFLVLNKIREYQFEHNFHLILGVQQPDVANSQFFQRQSKSFCAFIFISVLQSRKYFFRLRNLNYGSSPAPDPASTEICHINLKNICFYSLISTKKWN